MKFFKKKSKSRKKKSEISLGVAVVSSLQTSKNPLFKSTSKPKEGVEASELGSQKAEGNSFFYSARKFSKNAKPDTYSSSCEHHKVARERTTATNEFLKLECYDEKQMSSENDNVKFGRKKHSHTHLPMTNKNESQIGSGNILPNKGGNYLKPNLGNTCGRRKSSQEFTTQISRAACEVSTKTKSTTLKIFPSIKLTKSKIQQLDRSRTNLNVSKESDLNVSGMVNSNSKTSSNLAREVDIKCNVKQVDFFRKQFPCEKISSKFEANSESEPPMKTKVKKVKRKPQSKSVRGKKERTKNSIDGNPKVTGLVRMETTSSPQKHLNRFIKKQNTFLSEDKIVIKNDNIGDATSERDLFSLCALQNCVQYQTHFQNPIYQQLLQLNHQSTRRGTCRNTFKEKPRPWGFESIGFDGTFSVFLY